MEDKRESGTSAMALTSGAVLLLVAAMAALIPAEVSAAARGAVVAVPLGGGVEREAAVIGQAIEDAVVRGRHLEMVDLAWHADGRTAERRGERLEQGKEVLGYAKEAYETNDFAGAMSLLEEAISVLEQADLVRDMEYLLEAHSLRALTAYYRGDTLEAGEAVARLFSLSPAYVFEGSRFPSQFREMADEVRREVQAEASMTIEVLMGPLPARVFVNGVYRGIAPLEVDGLSPAEHYVTVRALGYRSIQEQRFARPGALLRLEPETSSDGDVLGEMLEEARERMRSGVVAEPGAAIARWAFLDEVLVVGVRPEEDRRRVTMVRVAEDGHVLASTQEVVEVDDPAGVADVAAAAVRLYRDDIPRGPEGRPIRAVVRVAPLVDHSRAGFIIGGAGIAAGLGGVAVGLHARSTALRAKELPQRHQEEIQPIVGRARRSALVADILFASALVAITAGSYLAAPALTEALGSGDELDRFSVAPAPLPGGAVVTVGGEF